MAVAAPASTRDLTRREAATLRANWTEVATHLTPPGIAWAWSESGLSERMKHYLKAHGLIRRHSTVEGAWETEDKLWMWVIDQAADDEPVGCEASGQETLPIDVQHTTAVSTRSRTARTVSTPPRWRGEARQVTLAGDTVEPDDPVNLDEIDASGTRAATNAKQDPTRKTGREKAAHHPAQARLSAWVGRVGRLTRPRGEVMSIEDWVDLSPMQRGHVRLDVDATDYAEAKGELVVNNASSAADAVDRFEGVMQMSSAGTQKGFRAADENNVIGVADTDEWEMDGLFDDASPVEAIDKSDSEVTVTTTDGSTSRYSRDYWDVAEPLINEYADEIVSGDTIPLKATLETGESVVLAPRVENN